MQFTWIIKAKDGAKAISKTFTKPFKFIKNTFKKQGASDLPPADKPIINDDQGSKRKRGVKRVVYNDKVVLHSFCSEQSISMNTLATASTQSSLDTHVIETTPVSSREMIEFALADLLKAHPNPQRRQTIDVTSSAMITKVLPPPPPPSRCQELAFVVPQVPGPFKKHPWSTTPHGYQVISRTRQFLLAENVHLVSKRTLSCCAWIA